MGPVLMAGPTQKEKTMRKENAIQTINVMQSSYAHIRHNDAEWEALEMAKEELRVNQFNRIAGYVPLTVKQLREMDGEIVLIGDANGNIAEKGFVRANREFVSGEDRTKYYFDCAGKTWFAYPYDIHTIDMEECTSEWKEYTGADAGFHYCSRCDQQAFNYEDGGEVVEVLSDFCPSCGRATTKNGIDILKKRMEEIR